MNNNIYFTYRQHFTNTGVKYDISYYNDKQYSDYKEAWLTKIVDWDSFIPSDRITKEIVPWVKSLRKAWVLKYIDWLNPTELQASLQNVAQGFWITMKTAIEMKQWIRDNTDLIEETDWKFLIREATNDWIDWPQEAKYLEIV